MIDEWMILSSCALLQPPADREFIVAYGHNSTRRSSILCCSGSSRAYWITVLDTVAWWEMSEPNPIARHSGFLDPFNTDSTDLKWMIMEKPGTDSDPDKRVSEFTELSPQWRPAHGLLGLTFDLWGKLSRVSGLEQLQLLVQVTNCQIHIPGVQSWRQKSSMKDTLFNF